MKFIKCFSMLLVYLIFNFTILAGQGEDTEFCTERGEVEALQLPDNMRFIVHRVGQPELYLRNPHDERETAIPNTSNLESDSGIPAMPLLYNDGMGMVLARYIVGNRTSLVTMGIDGSDARLVQDGAADPHLLTGNRVLYMNSVIDLNTLNSYPVELPEELLGISERTFVRFSPNGDRVAYFADDVMKVNEGNRPSVTRIYHLSSEDYIDIDIRQWERAVFFWHNHPSFISIHPFNSDGTIHVYDTNTGDLVFTVSQSSIDIAYEPSEISWSPDEEKVAVSYDIYPNPPQPIIGIQSPESPILDYCFVVETNQADAIRSYPDSQTIFWTPDGRYIWWLECEQICSVLSNSDPFAYYDLLIANVETGEYAVALEDVGLYTRIGFMEGRS